MGYLKKSQVFLKIIILRRLSSGLELCLDYSVLSRLWEPITKNDPGSRKHGQDLDNTLVTLIALTLSFPNEEVFVALGELPCGGRVSETIRASYLRKWNHPFSQLPFALFSCLYFRCLHASSANRLSKRTFNAFSRF